MGYHNRAAHSITPSSSAGYYPGENWVMCMVCGFRVRASAAHWDDDVGYVCVKDLDEYNPQADDLQAVEERIVPDKVSVEPGRAAIVYITTKLTAADFPPGDGSTVRTPGEGDTWQGDPATWQGDPVTW